MHIELPEVMAVAALFGLASAAATVIGNYFVLRSQIVDLKKMVEKLIEHVQSHGERLIALEITCKTRHGELLK